MKVNGVINIVEQSFAHKVNKVEFNIKTYHVIYNMLCDFILKGYNITLDFFLKYKLYIEPSL